MSKRAYDSIRSLVEELGGSMTYERAGYRHGAWIIRIGKGHKIIEAEGVHSFPLLDRLLEPKPNKQGPKNWDDYSNQLVLDAEKKLLAMLDYEP